MVDVFTVRGREKYDKSLLICNKLEFKRGLAPNRESKLVIVPETGAMEGAPRVLKIIANKIDLTDAWDSASQSCVAEITYDLDGDPLGKLDPECPAKDIVADPQYLLAHRGADGNPDYGHGPGDPAGPYPVADHGGHGQQGKRGDKGKKGQDAPILEIWVREVDGQGLTIDLRGQQGGKGGKGGRGGNGGGGQKGAPAELEDDWIGKSCKQGPGRGGDGGNGGNAGWGGDGGDGGNGGVVKVFYTAIGGANSSISTWSFDLQGGLGADHGDGGEVGKLGKGGPAGPKKVVCSEGEAGQDGIDGLTVQEILQRKDGSPESSPGQPGADGYHTITQVTNLPRFP